MAIQRGLKTRDLLAKRTSIPDPRCTLYSGSDETCNHLFLDCPYSCQVWNSIAQKFKVGQCPSSIIRQHIEEFLRKRDVSKKDNSTLGRLCFSAYTWQIWKKRNSRVFHNEQRLWDPFWRTLCNRLEAERSLSLPRCLHRSCCWLEHPISECNHQA